MSLSDYITGISLSPSTGEFAYDILPYKVEEKVVNCWSDGSMTNTDIEIALQKIKENYPNCKTLNLIISWFCDNIDVSKAKIFPSTVYQNMDIKSLQNNIWIEDDWICSGLTQNSDLISLPLGLYTGTPSDSSILRILKYLKNEGYTVIFTPKILMLNTDYKTSDLTFSDDISQNATNAINTFMGNATPQMFIQNVDDTVSYSGNLQDWTYRRMILHYATLCALSESVDVFVVGVGFVGLEKLRGPNWTMIGQHTSFGTKWDYPFIDEINLLINDVASIIPEVKLTYSSHWTTWMGCIHSDGSKIPNLDQMYMNENISFISIDGYYPLSDWKDGGLDQQNWNNLPIPLTMAYPPSSALSNNLGLSGTPSILDINYLKANIEGGEFYNWYYNDSGISVDIDNNISLPNGDRGNQDRKTYIIRQELYAVKSLRWWWENTHQAIYNSPGMGFVAHGNKSQWLPYSKSIVFLEYGFKAIDKCTNQPDSFEPYWCNLIKNNDVYYPISDTNLYQIAYQAIFEYWKDNNQTKNIVALINQDYSTISNYDVRPYPTFPLTTPWDVSFFNYYKWLHGSLK